MFEDKTFRNLLATALAAAPADVDTRQGSIYRDAIVGPLLVMAGFYVDLENLRSLININTAVDDYLDDIGEMFGVERQQATLAKYNAVITGTMPNEGSQFIVGGTYFDFFYADDGTPYFECETIGSDGNGFLSGTPAIPVENIDGLDAASLGALMEAAADKEENSVYRERIQKRISGPAENGNKQNYKTWCESVMGVGRARIIPLWNGPNTVKAYIYGENYEPASAQVVARVQEYVDPDDDNDGEGDGMGEGVSNLGAKFTAVAPTALPLDISVAVVLASGFDLVNVTAVIRKALIDYLHGIVRDNSDDEASPIIRYNAIGTVIMDADGVLDYHGLTVNGSNVNIQPSIDEVCTLGILSVTESE